MLTFIAIRVIIKVQDKRKTMNLQFKTQDDFNEFKADLKRRLADRTIKRIEMPDFMPSAVMILLMNINNEAHVFLTKRTNTVGTHKGEISFPGGRIEEEDENPMAAAFRETYEEAGIKPGDIELIGQFDEFYSVEGFHVSTFIGAIEYPYEYKINTGEIEVCLEAPLVKFYNQDYDRTDKINLNDREITVYFYSYNGFSIWGLTARILTELGIRVLRDQEPKK